MNWAIVAIPAEDDYVWKLSSEKIPHLTILSLGEHDDPEMARKIVAYLEHVANTSMHRFGLSVDKRGKLGPNDADVLFFRDEWSNPKIEEVRGYLLKNFAVRDGYDSTDQYEKWTPHLTLGFPDSPAKPDERDYPGTHYVNFDKIALWTDNYTGPTFELPRHEDSLAMDDKAFALEAIAQVYGVDPNDVLHFGVKGMQWGVRRDRAAGLKGLGPDKIVRTTKSGDSITMTKNPPGSISKTLAFASKKYAKVYEDGAFLTITDKSGKKVGDACLNKRGNDELYLNWIGIKPGARGNGYATAALKAAEEFGGQAGFKRMTLEVPGNAPDARHIYEKLGFKVVKEDINPDDEIWGGLTEMVYEFDRVQQSALAHADSGDYNLEDEYGWFLEGIARYVSDNPDEFEEEESMEMSDRDFALASIAQSLGVDPDDVLHFGVKGMRWGVRKSDVDSLGVSAKTAASARKDADEYTRAKMFYGTGAGNRRKLINARVSEKSKDPDYKKAFDHYVNKTDLSKRADQAKGERRRKDVAAGTAKTARGIKNVVVGNPQAASLAALGIVGGAKYLKDSGLSQKAVDSISKLAANRNNRKAVSDLLRSMGIKHSDTDIDNFDLDEFLLEHGLTDGMVPESVMDTIEDHFLEHFGVKGMKWGVRRDVTGARPIARTLERSAFGRASAANVNRYNAKKSAKTKAKADKTQAKADKAKAASDHKEWKKNAQSSATANKVFQQALKDFQPTVKILNNDANYKGKDLTKDRKLARDYDHAWTTLFNQQLAQTSVNMTMTNSGRAMVYQFDRQTGMLKATEMQAVLDHAEKEATQAFEFPEFRVELDDLGQVVRIVMVKAALSQSVMDAIDDHFLEHFGVKGMRWGVRNGVGSPTAGTHSEDAREAASIQAKAKAGGGVSALSNSDLKKINERLNLETNYSRLTSEKSQLDSATSAVKKLLDIGQTANNTNNFIHSPVGSALIAAATGGKVKPSVKGKGKNK